MFRNKREKERKKNEKKKKKKRTRSQDVKHRCVSRVVKFSRYPARMRCSSLTNIDTRRKNAGGLSLSLSIFIQRGPWPLVNSGEELCVSRSHHANILAASTYFIFFTRFLLARATLKSDERTPSLQGNRCNFLDIRKIVTPNTFLPIFLQWCFV